MNMSLLEEAMGGKMPTEVSRVMRALARLDAAIDELHAVGLTVTVDQKRDYPGGRPKHRGFTCTIGGKFHVENIHVPDVPRNLRSA